MHNETCNPRMVLARAVLRAGDALGLKPGELATTLSIPETRLNRLTQHPPAENTATWVSAQMLLRLYLALDRITAGDTRIMQTWMHNHNRALGGKPAEIILQENGLTETVSYMENNLSRC